MNIICLKQGGYWDFDIQTKNILKFEYKVQILLTKISQNKNDIKLN